MSGGVHRRRSLARLNLINEFKVVCLRECPSPDGRACCISPGLAVRFWRNEIVKSQWYDPEKEALVVLCLCTRRRVKGFNLVTLGNLDCCIIHPREVFRPAIVVSASAVLLMHNHPSGDPTPSEPDVRATQMLVTAGKLLKIELVDHIIVGRRTKKNPRGYYSFRMANILL